MGTLEHPPWRRVVHPHDCPCLRCASIPPMPAPPAQQGEPQAPPPSPDLPPLLDAELDVALALPTFVATEEMELEQKPHSVAAPVVEAPQATRGIRQMATTKFLRARGMDGTVPKNADDEKRICEICQSRPRQLVAVFSCSTAICIHLYDVCYECTAKAEAMDTDEFVGFVPG